MIQILIDIFADYEEFSIYKSKEIIDECHIWNYIVDIIKWKIMTVNHS